MEKILLLTGWAIKVIVGFSFVYIYTNYYGDGELSGDSGAYFKEAKILLKIKKSNPDDYYSIIFNENNAEELIAKYFQAIPNSRFSRQISGINDTRIHIKTISLFMIFLGTNYLFLFMTFFFLSYLGIIILWLSIKEQVKINRILSFCLFLLPPNLLFWTSSNLKETIFIFGLCLCFIYFLSNRKKARSISSLVAGSIILLFFKPILLLILLFSWTSFQLINKGFIEKQRVYVAILGFGMFGIFIFHIPQKALKTLSDKQFDFINVARGGIQVKGDTSFYYISSELKDKINIHDSIVSIKEAIPATSNLFGKIRNEKEIILQPNKEKLNLVYLQIGGGSYFEISPVNNNYFNLFLAVPEALANTFFRPFIWEKGNLEFQLILFIENIFFFGLLLFSILKYKNIKEEHLDLFYTAILSIFLLSLIIGITTPISGALIRYRIPIQLLIIIVFILTTIKKDHAK